jgi:hypothetical protein
MGEISRPSDCLPLLAAFSRYPQALHWARQKAIEAWGAVALESGWFSFGETDYYQTTMGAGLSN